MKSEEKSLQVIKFSGKKQEWKVWSMKFLSRAAKRDYRKLLEGNTKVPTQSAYDTACSQDKPTPIHKKTIKNYDLSVVAFEDLILSISG